MYRKEGKRRKWGILLLVLLAAAAALLGAAYYLLTKYRIETVYVEGNLHYTKEEIMEIVMDGPLGDNSLYLSMKYKNEGVDNIPFVAAMNVEVLTADTIKIKVFEKSLAGFIEYLGKYMYFDKEGTIVESSSVKTVGIPEITGIAFEYVVVGEVLPVEDDGIFSNILTLTQTLSKYSLTADRIYFDSQGAMTIFFGEVKVAFGKDNLLDEKIMRLKNILPGLEGQKGTLRMENYNENTKVTTFEPDSK